MGWSSKHREKNPYRYPRCMWCGKLAKHPNMVTSTSVCSSCHDSLNLSILNGSTKVIHSRYKHIHNNTFIHSNLMFGTRSTKSWIDLQPFKKPHDMLWIYVPLKPSHDPKWEGDTGDCCFKLFHIILVVVYISGWHSSSKPWKIL